MRKFEAGIEQRNSEFGNVKVAAFVILGSAVLTLFQGLIGNRTTGAMPPVG